ncbi:hypothetical protein NPN14_25815, partial [Vibrio parahaemolyticus]|uniref:hypothetical protein n=1 Tax=Vibrio parahaemolyticus TaxID=670 RepID=UPI00211305AC
RTCGPLIVSQMAGRFRKVKNFNIWVNPVGLKATEDLEKLNDMYMKNIENQTLFEWDNATNTKKIKNAAYYNIFINSM